MVSTGNAIRDQLAAIMEERPETIDDEDLLAARWFQVYGGLNEAMSVCEHEVPLYGADFAKIRLIRNVIRVYRQYNIRERRRELKDLYPFSEEEEARRQKRGRQGAPGG